MDKMTQGLYIVHLFIQLFRSLESTGPSRWVKSLYRYSSGWCQGVKHGSIVVVITLCFLYFGPIYIMAGFYL